MRSRRRRGDLEVGLPTLIEIVIFSGLAILMLLVGLKIYHVFFDADKQSLNAYRLAGDNIESMLAGEEKDIERTVLFTFSRKIPYKGAIYAVNPDGTFSKYGFSPSAADQNVASLMVDSTGAPVDGRTISRKCKTGCICFVKSFPDVAPLEKGGAQPRTSALMAPYECKALSAGSRLEINISPGCYHKDEGKFLDMVLKKDATHAGVTTVYLWQKDGAVLCKDAGGYGYDWYPTMSGGP